MAIFNDTIVLGKAKGKAKPKAPQGPPRDPLLGGADFHPKRVTWVIFKVFGGKLPKNHQFPPFKEKMTKNHHKSWKSPEICRKSCFPSTRADPSRPRRENINNPIGILRFREPSQRLMKWQLQWKSRIFVKSVEFHGIPWKSIEFHENV